MKPLQPPELIVFDLDFTLWDCGGTWCDCLAPPFHTRGGKVLDRTGRHVRLYEDVPRILDDCDGQSIRYAVASRTEQPTWAREILELLQITHRFVLAEIYPASKLKHFAALRDASGVEFDEMLFFDDEMRNIREVSDLGVPSIYVESGLTASLFQEGLRTFAASREAS